MNVINVMKHMIERGGHMGINKCIVNIVSILLVADLGATPFKSETITTNEVYKKIILVDDARGCVEAGDSSHSYVESQMHAQYKLQLASYLAYCYMRKDARNEFKWHTQGSVKSITLEPEGWTDFPRAISDFDFEYRGYKCSEYDVIVIPFVVRNPKCERSLEEVVCKFRHKDEFVFALYVNLNVTSVSCDFIEDSHCAKLLTRIARFPFLNADESRRQWNIVNNGGKRLRLVP